MIFNMVLSLLAIGVLGLCVVLISLIIKTNKKTFNFVSIISLIIFSGITLTGILIGVDDLLNTNITENLISKISTKYSSSDSFIEETNTTVNSTDDSNNESTQNKKELTDNIEVEIDWQDIINKKKKLVVHITNNNVTESFNGTINVLTKNSSNKNSGGDTIFIDNLPPQQNTSAILWVEPNANSCTYSIEGDFTEALSIESTLNYEIARNFSGNGNVELFIVVEDLSINNLKLISHELKQKYTSNIATVLSAYFYSTAEKEYAVTGSFPENELISFSLNYKTNESELVIPHIDNTLNELFFERIPIQ